MAINFWEKFKEVLSYQKPQPKAMEFKVGEGITPAMGTTEDKAKEGIKQLIARTPKQIPGSGDNLKDFLKTVVRATPRAFIQGGLSISGQKEYQPITKAERFVFGTEPVKDIKTTGVETLKDFGTSEQTAQRYGMGVGLLFAGLDIVPGLPGKKQIAKETVEQLIKKFGKEVGEQIIKKGGKELAEKAIQEGGERIVSQILKKEVKPLLKAIPLAQKGAIPAIPAPKGIIPQERQPFAQEARKTYRIIKQEGIREVKGTPVKIVDGVDTFIHEGTGGWVVSEASTGRYLADSVSKEGAIAKAKFNISNLGEDKFRKLISENQLSTQAVKGGGEVATKIPVSIKESVATKIPVRFTQARNTVEKLWNAIKEAGPVRKEQEALYSAERAKRTARMASVGKSVGGEKGFFTQLGQLKGEMPKAKFDAIRKSFSQPEVDSLFDLVEKAKLLPFEKITAKTGLSRLFEGRIPTTGELDLMREVFPRELIEEILTKRPFSQKLFSALGQIINTPRAVMASVDLSAPLRQGIFLIGRPKQFLNSFGNMFKYAFSEKAYVGLDDYIKAKPTYEAMRKGKLAFTDLGSGLTGREEVIMANLPERIPLMGKIFRGSNRAYTGFLNKLRVDVFDDIVTKAKIAGKDLSQMELEGLGKFVNAATGRGDIGILQKAAPVLNATFFSPRLIASRVNLLNPYFYATLPKIARKEALKSLFSFAGITGGILGLAKLGGADVGIDPRNADFGKIKVGNTRYDILGGFQQYARLIAQLWTGEIISSTTGRTITLGEGFKPLTRFFENKESPIASFVTGLLTGQTSVGEDFDLPTEVINRFIPMVIQDMYDLSQEEGAEKIMMGLPAIFGVGVQTYGKQELAFGESKIGEPTAQVRPIPELADKIRELVLGQLPLGSSKRFSVEAYFDQLSNLPREEAADIYDKINEANPDLAKQIRDVVKEREMGITVKDKDLKSKGVASGDRALAVKEELNKLNTKEEKAVLWDEYVRKGIITKEVKRQLLILLKK